MQQTPAPRDDIAHPPSGRWPRQRQRPRPAIASYAGPAFAVWAVTLALAVLLHEWAAVESPWSPYLITGVAALAVLLRPGVVWRTIVLLGCTVVEFVHTLPQPYNDQTLIALTGSVVVVWWVRLRLRAPSVARDPAAVYERIAPFLRVAFLVASFAAAFARLNTGFLSSLGSCAPKLFDEIPTVALPTQTYGAAAMVMIAVRFGIPTLLLLRRTRPLGVLLGLAYALFLVVGGDPALSSSTWAFLVLFVPTGTLARVAASLRGQVLRYYWRRLGPLLHSPLLWLLVSGIFALGLSVMDIAPQAVRSFLHQRPPSLFCLLWLLLWGWALCKHRAGLRRSDMAGGLRVRSVVLGAGIVALVLNAASPYVGLKSQYSFVDWSSLRTEPGRWNHLLVPEAARVFDLQDGRVRLIRSDGPHQLQELLEHVDDDEMPLAEARRLLAKYPDAAMYYEIDGRLRLADPVRDDPVLGGPVPELLRLFGGFRRPETDGSCQM